MMFFIRKKAVDITTKLFVPEYKFGQIIEGIALVDNGNNRYYVVGKLVKETEDHIFVLETQEIKHFNNNFVVAIEKENICYVHERETKGEDING